MQLKLLNLNAWILPLKLSVDNKERVNKILALIKKLDPDIITLQEVWTRASLNRIIRLISGYSVACNPHWFFNKSGLITLSKRPIISNRLFIFKPRKEYKFYERIVKKGFMVTRISVDKKEVDIVNTHLYQSDQGSKEKHKKITQEQFKCLERHFLTSPRPTITMGDFNIHYEKIIQINGFFKIPQNESLPTVSKSNKLTNKRFNKTRVQSQQVDYLMYRENGMKMNVITKVFNNLILSDHYPLYSLIYFG